jgi:hypothetical protein
MLDSSIPLLFKGINILGESSASISSDLQDPISDLEYPFALIAVQWRCGEGN